MPVSVCQEGAGTKVTIHGGTATRVALASKTVAAIANGRPGIVVQGGATTREVAGSQTTTTVATPGVPGPRGPSGATGAAIITLPIGAAVQSGYAVRAASGAIWPVDTSDEAHADQVIGIATQSVTTIGADCEVQRAGEYTDSHWTWQAGVVWVGANGALTQAPASSGWYMRIARVLSATSIDIDIEPPIFR